MSRVVSAAAAVVEARGASRAVALRRSSARLREVLAALRRLGVADPDLRTRAMTVARRRDRRGRKLPGYIARGGVTATVRDVSRTGAVVDDSDLVGFDEDSGGGGGQEQGRRVAAPTEPGRTQVFGTVYVVFEAG